MVINGKLSFRASMTATVSPACDEESLRNMNIVAMFKRFLVASFPPSAAPTLACLLEEKAE